MVNGFFVEMVRSQTFFAREQFELRRGDEAQNKTQHGATRTVARNGFCEISLDFERYLATMAGAGVSLHGIRIQRGD